MPRILKSKQSAGLPPSMVFDELWADANKKTLKTTLVELLKKNARTSCNNLNKLQSQRPTFKIDWDSRPPQVPLRELFPQAAVGLALGFDLSHLERPFESAVTVSSSLSSSSAVTTATPYTSEDEAPPSHSPYWYAELPPPGIQNPSTPPCPSHECHCHGYLVQTGMAVWEGKKESERLQMEREEEDGNVMGVWYGDVVDENGETMIERGEEEEEEEEEEDEEDEDDEPEQQQQQVLSEELDRSEGWADRLWAVPRPHTGAEIRALFEERIRVLRAEGKLEVPFA